MPSDGKIASKAEIPRTKFQPRLNFMPGERYSVNGAVGILVCVCNVTCGWSRDELQREPGSLDCWENTSKTFPTLELGCSPKATSTPCLLGKLSRSCKACGLSFRFLCTLSLEMLDSSLGIWGKFPNFEVRGGSHFRLGSCEFFFFCSHFMMPEKSYMVPYLETSRRPQSHMILSWTAPQLLTLERCAPSFLSF